MIREGTPPSRQVHRFQAFLHFGVDLHSLPGFSMDDEDLKERAERDGKRKKSHKHGHGHGFGDDDYSDDTGGPSGGSEGGSGGTSLTRLLAPNAYGRPQTIELTGAQQARLGYGYDPGPVDLYLALAKEMSAPDGGINSGSTYRAPFKIHDVGSSQDGESITDVDAEINRYLKQAGGLSKENPHGSSMSYPPGSPAARRAAEQRALAGSRPQSWK
jgi:hypothetical protein